MISLRSVKTTSYYATSCLEVNTKQKVKCPFVEGAVEKTSVSIRFLIQSYFLVVHVCRNRNFCQTRLLLLSGIMSMKREVCTKVNFHYRCILIPITKMLNWLLISHEHVCKISCINSVGILINSIVSLFASYSYSRKIKV